MNPAAEALAKAEAAARALDWKTATQEIARAAQLFESSPITRGPQDGGAKEMAWEMRQVKQRIDDALAGAAGIYMEASADRSDVVAGESLHDLNACSRLDKHAHEGVSQAMQPESRRIFQPGGACAASGARAASASTATLT